MKKITVKDFYQEKKEDFSLSVVTTPKTLKNTISSQYLNRPGLVISGFFDRFAYRRIQILGETEISFMQTFDDGALYDRLREILMYGIPCFIVTKGLSVPKQMEYLADEMNIAILSSRLTTDRLYLALRKYLEKVFAPTKSMHGTLVDVYGVGVMLTGKSGIGKSEAALDLVERGHRLITDDVVKLRLNDETVLGMPSNDYGHFMEIRGVGLIDVEKMFGIQAVRKKKRVGVQVELMPWSDNMDYERIGLTDNLVDILGIKIPIVYLPVSPGKNVSVIIEVIALNHILKIYGYDAAQEYAQRLQQELAKKAQKRSHIIKQEI